MYITLINKEHIVRSNTISTKLVKQRYQYCFVRHCNTKLLVKIMGILLFSYMFV